MWLSLLMLLSCWAGQTCGAYQLVRNVVENMRAGEGVILLRMAREGLAKKLTPEKKWD